VSDLVIRPVAAQDEKEWRRLWRAYLVFYQTSVQESVYATSFKRLLGSHDQDFHGLIATLDGRAVGLVHYLFHRHMWKIENVVYLQDLYADPEVRGRGVGRGLINAVYAAADAKGAPAVYWLTQDFNKPARILYDKVAKLTPFIRYNRA